MNEYEEELQIDMYALETEWVDQPRRFFKYAEALAEAKHDLDKAKEALEVKKANLDQAIRQAPESYGLGGKVTEAGIGNAIILDETYGKLRNRVHEASHLVELLGAAVRAFDQRKCALENLVRLHGQQYFSAPEVTEVSQETRESIKTAERDDLRKRQRRRMNPGE